VVETVNINELIEEMGRMLEVSISKKVVLRYNFSRDLPAIQADTTQLRQVIMNMVINASDATGERSGVVSITTGCMLCDRHYLDGTWLAERLPEGYYVFIEVADTGCGMDQETMKKIFDPFFTTKFTGRGLGLAAVLGIVRGHHGAVRVYSEPGKGTTFKVLLPAAGAPGDSFAADDGCGDDWSASGTVLLVDDEETVRALGARMLERCGFTVLAASDGREALDIFRERAAEIVCVILDLTMPHMDGDETFRNMRNLDSGVRVIMSSGYNEQEVTQRFAGKGLVGFIQKPYRFEELVKKLRSVLG
jgi:CheY-like chemotaxis protein